MANFNEQEKTKLIFYIFYMRQGHLNQAIPFEYKVKTEFLKNLSKLNNE